MSMNAVFNETGEDGLPKIEPETDVLLVSATVHTRHGGIAPKKTVYTFAELSGAGRILAGLAPERITWTIEAFAANDAARIAFANQLRQYANSTGRYELKSERGEVWQYVELRSFRSTARPEDCQSDEVWCGWEVSFEWMQPAEEVGT